MSGGPEVSSGPDAHTLMQRVARLEKELFYLQDRVACAERAPPLSALEKRVKFLEQTLTDIHGRFYMKQEAEKERDEPASE